MVEMPVECQTNSILDELEPEDKDSASTQLRISPSLNDAPTWAIELQSIIAFRLMGLEDKLQTLSDRFDRHLDRNFESGTSLPAEAESPQVELNPDRLTSNLQKGVDGSQSESDDWMNVMLGPGLCEDPHLEHSISWIKKNARSGNLHALALTGQLLVFRCATSDRKPSLLKDVGEAYYRCFPKTRDRNDPLEVALVAWSRQQCEGAGLPNSIELVDLGERFDAARHSSIERGGVEVVEVLGWIVLREGNKVYSKASVQTR